MLTENASMASSCTWSSTTTWAENRIGGVSLALEERNGGADGEARGSTKAFMPSMPELSVDCINYLQSEPVYTRSPRYIASRALSGKTVPYYGYAGTAEKP